MATEDGWIVVWSGAKDGPHRGLLSIPAVQPREPDRIDRRMAARVHETRGATLPEWRYTPTRAFSGD